MDLQTLKKIYASLEVLHNIGVEPNEAQLALLSRYEEELIQAAAKDFICKVGEVRRPFLMELDYKPEHSSVPTIVIDEKELPITLSAVKSEETPVATNQIGSVTVVETEARSKSEDKPEIEFELKFKAGDTLKAIPHPKEEFKVAPKIEIEPISKKETPSTPADDFFASLYYTPEEENKQKQTRKKYSLNGSQFMKKEELVFKIIKLYVKHHPAATFRDLQLVFKDDYCENRFKSIGFLVSDDDLEDWSYNGKYNFYHGNIPKYRLISADGIAFYHYASWTHETLIPIIELAESFGYRITTDKD